MSSPRVLSIGSLQLVLRSSSFRVVTGLAGWGDTAPVRAGFDDITGRHGSFGGMALYAGRPIAVSGRINEPTHAEALQVRDSLASLGIQSEHALTVDEGDAPPLSAFVRVNRGAVFEWVTNVSFRYSLELIALDPFKRATTARTTVVGAGATVTATNDGTAAADLLVTLTSGGTVVLSAGGVTLTTGVLPAGAVIDTGSTSILAADGSDLMTLVAMPPLMPRLPAGGGNVTQAGTAGLSIEHFDTYA